MCLSSVINLFENLIIIIQGLLQCYMFLTIARIDQQQNNKSQDKMNFEITSRLKIKRYLIGFIISIL